MNPKELIKDLESMRDMAELKALSSYSLEHTLSDEQFKRMMELKNKVFPDGKATKV